MKIKIPTVQIIEVDLHSLSFNDWPKEAQDAARIILSNAHIRRKYEQELPELRKSWLIERVDKWLNTSIDDL